jgi:hypothetical protein
MIRAHRGLFGPVGETVARFVLKHAPTLFDLPLDPLAFRVELAPDELGPYGRHTAYTVTGAAFILLNRFRCDFARNEIVLLDARDAEDTIVHELTHNRQAMLLGTHHIRNARGDHRDAGWYGAISEACARYLGCRFDCEVWPSWKSVRRNGKVGKEMRAGTLDEKTVCHWPQAMRTLVEAKDPRLPKC